jgi:hypothetical protein
LGVDCFTVLVDKSYQNGREITQCISNNITTIVAHPTPGTSKESVTQPDYLVAKFKYNAENSYECPQGETLKTTGSIKKRANRTKVSI